jgi:hypothetical protein
VLVFSGVDVAERVGIEFGWTVSMTDPQSGEVLDRFNRVRANGPGRSNAGYMWTSGTGAGPTNPGFDAEGGVGHFRWDTGDTNFTWYYGWNWGGAIPGSVVDVQMDVKFNECDALVHGHWYRAALLLEVSPVNADSASGTYGIIGPDCPAAQSRPATAGRVSASRDWELGEPWQLDVPDIELGEWWTVRYYADMSISHIKAWPQGTPEPADWQFSNSQPFENGGSYYPNGGFRFWRYVDTEVDNLLDRRPFYPMSERRRAWESFWREDAAESGPFDWALPSEWSFTTAGDVSEPELVNPSGLAILWADDFDALSSTTIERQITGGELDGDFELVTQFAHGALQPFDEHVRLRAGDAGGRSIEVDLLLRDGGGTIGFTGGTTTPFGWAGYSPDPESPRIGSTYFVRWQHTADGDRLKVWEDGRLEPGAWQVENAPVAGWGNGTDLAVTYSADAYDRWAGGWLGLYFIDFE